MVGKIDRGRLHVPRPEDARQGVYTVVQGDTMSGIARAFGKDLAELLALNGHIRDANRIFPGQRIALEAPKTETAPGAKADASERTLEASAGAPTPTPIDVATTIEAPVDVQESKSAAGVTVRAGTTPGAGSSSGRTTTDRIVGEAEKQLAKLLMKEHSLDKELKLGAFGTGSVALKSSATTDAGYDYARTRFAEQAAKDGKQAVFVRTEGSLALNAGHTFSKTRADGSAGGSAELRGGASAQFELVRGHTFDKANPDAVALAKGILKTSTTELPLSAKLARTMEPGASFSLNVKGDVAANAERDGVRLSGTAKREHAVHARFLGDHKVEVRLERAQHKEGNASVNKTEGDKRFSARADASDDQSQTAYYTLDLSRPAGAAAYDALLKGRTHDADAASKTDGSGVERSYAWGSRTTERVLETKAGVGGTETKPTSVDVALSSRSRTTLDLESGTRTTRKQLGADVDLTTPIREGSVLGLSANAERTAELTLPGATKVEGEPNLPLDAASARALPQGASFELRGRGTIGATVAHKRDRTKPDDDGAEVSGTSTRVDAQLSRTGDVDIRVRRGEGDAVDVAVTVRSTVQKGVEGARTHNKKGVSVGLTGSDKRTSIKEETATLSLDLDKPTHRAAYDAALRGDLGPARALGKDVVKDRALWSHDTKLGFDVSNVDKWSVVGSWQRELISSDDWRVTADVDRQATMTAALERGEEVRWVNVSTALTPGARVSFGSVAKAGFDASAELRVSALMPEGKSSTIPDVPFKASEALALPRGAEVTLAGRAKVSSLWGVTYGADVEAAVARASASISITHEQILVDRAIEVTTKRLDGNRVELRMEEAKSTGHKTGIEARIGVDTNLKAVPGAGAIEKLPLGSTILDRAEATLDQNLAIAAGHERGRTQTSSKGMTLTLDLSTPAARSAYEAFLKGNAEPALALTQKTPGADSEAGDTKPTASVEARRETRRTESSSKTHLTIAGDAVFLREALRSDSATIESWGGGSTTTTDMSSFLEKRKGLFSKGDLRVDAVRIRTDDDPVGRGYFHVRVTGKDTMTSKREMKEMLALGESLGAAPVRPVKAEADDKRGIKKIFGSAARHGTTHTEIELFVTQKGIDELRQKTGADGAMAYARYLTSVDGQAPSWAGPRAAEAKAMIAEWDDKRSDQSASEDVRTAYWHKFKRNIWEDAESLESAQAIARAIEGMKKSEDPVHWNKTFADLGKQLKIDITGAVAAINDLVGADEILVHRFAVKGRSVDVEMKDEGLLSP